jgi:hypothetical protein
MRKREDFERNIHMLIEATKSGKFHPGKGKTAKNIFKLRRLPNGRVNFLTVDESTRTAANLIAMRSQTAEEQFT